LQKELREVLMNYEKPVHRIEIKMNVHAGNLSLSFCVV
jgi:hypothetical protein